SKGPRWSAVAIRAAPGAHHVRSPNKHLLVHNSAAGRPPVTKQAGRIDSPEPTRNEIRSQVVDSPSRNRVSTVGSPPKLGPRSELQWGAAVTRLLIVLTFSL